ncbi:MAG: response regulator transcription factor [bacterium]|nr:response regulator transcription factor [bacterium]
MAGILVLEDDMSVNRGISFLLEKAGYEVYSCETIVDAKKIVMDKRPELIICDINLPDGSGLDCITWVREKHNAYIICLTALDQELDLVMGYEAGADDYVTKPFSLSVLMLKIDAYYKRNRKTIVKRIIRTGDIDIYQDEMKIKLNGEEIALTKNEWRLLSHFIAHPKQILSKNQILENVFDTKDSFVDENMVAVNVRRLREKIKDNNSKPVYIKNIRGLGYVWDKEVR